MSQPDESAPMLSPAPPVEVPASPAPNMQEAPVPSGAPYRVADPPAFATYAAPAPAGRRPWPVIGPALSVYAVLLWTFVVAGQFTTSWMTGAPLGQGIAAGSVLLATFAAWLAGLLRGRVAAPPRDAIFLVGRGIGIAVLAFVLFVISLVAATIAGHVSSRNHDLPIALALVGLATVAAILGPKLTSPTPPERTMRVRFAVVVMWIVGALLTFVAGADLAANG